MRLEIGSGEYPDGGDDIPVDIPALPAVAGVSTMDRLPFRFGSFAVLRANHMLGHQSYELVGVDTCNPWALASKPTAAAGVRADPPRAADQKGSS